MRNIEQITQFIKDSAKYYFRGGELCQEEWENEEDGGFKAFITSKIYLEIKRAYEAGYHAGAFDALTDIQQAGQAKDLTFQIEDNKVGAERKFLEWEKEQ